MNYRSPKDISWPFARTLFRKLFFLAINIKCSVPSPYARSNVRCDSFALFVGKRSRPNVADVEEERMAEKNIY